MQFRFEFLTDSPEEAARFLGKISTPAPTDERPSQSPAPIVPESAEPKRGRGRPRKPTAEAPTPDSQDPAQTSFISEAAPKGAKEADESQQAIVALAKGPAPLVVNGPEQRNVVTAPLLPSMDDLKAMLQKYQMQFGLAQMRTKLTEVGANRITDLGEDKLPAFYAARMAELAAV